MMNNNLNNMNTNSENEGVNKDLVKAVSTTVNTKKTYKKIIAGTLAASLALGGIAVGGTIYKNKVDAKNSEATSNTEDISEKPTNSSKTTLDTSVIESVKSSDEKEASTTGKAKYTKDENIYGILSDDGKLDQMYIVNQFEVSKGGKITDFGTYDEITNLTDTTKITTNDSKNSFTAKKGNFYYQGTNENAELPWKFDIEYALDGKPVSSDKLAGADGDMKIKITSEKNDKVNKLFYDNYMLQISLTLNNENTSNVISKDATVADAGESRQFNYTILPGDDADISLSAHITDFEMGGISIAAVPFSMSIDVPDSSSMLKGMNKLTDGVTELDDGVGDFRDGISEYVDGVSEFNDGVNTINENLAKVADGGSSISEGSAKISDGLSKIGKGGTGLCSGSSQINDTLNLLSAKLGSMDLSGLSPQDSAFLVQVIGGLSQNYSEFNSGLTSYVNGVSKVADNYSSFDSGLKKYTSGISKLSDGMDKLADGSEKLSNNGSKLYDGACELKDGTNKMKNGVSKMPEKTEEKIDEMMDDYVKEFDLVSFVDKDNKHINAVQFTLTTPEIKAEEVEEVEVVEEEAGFLEKLRDLFK